MRRWNGISNFSAQLSFRGELIERKGFPGSLDAVRVRGSTRDQLVRTTVLGIPERSVLFRPDRVGIEEADGSSMRARDDPLVSFEGHVETTPWDELQLAYFSGYTTWANFTAPFFLAGQGFQTEELEPWRERGEIWRRLFVWFPRTIATHSSQQTFYFGPDVLQRRVDYRIELAGGIEVAQYCTEHTAFSGITVPARHLAMRRDPTGHPTRAAVLIDTHVRDAEFW